MFARYLAYSTTLSVILSFERTVRYSVGVNLSHHLSFWLSKIP